MFLPSIASKYKVINQQNRTLSGESVFIPYPSEMNILAVRPQFSVSAKRPKDGMK